MADITSANFGFLKAHGAQLLELGALAERYFTDDPVTSLIKLRQYGEALAQLVAARAGVYRDYYEQQSDLLRRLKFDRVLPDEAGNLFHHIRSVGNRATHDNEGDHAQALTALKMARELGIWFHRTFGAKKAFSPGPFVPPADPSAATKVLSEELARLRTELEHFGASLGRS
jgi:type I restriction enzyme R subunit